MSIIQDKVTRPPFTAINEENIERAPDLILLDRRVTFDKVAHCLQIIHGSVYEIIHNRLGFHSLRKMELSLVTKHGFIITTRRVAEDHYIKRAKSVFLNEVRSSVDYLSIFTDLRHALRICCTLDSRLMAYD
ncbi:hypothetical protein LAZ67_1003696 [Cordylochernes scorpioides]|uniref:Uncharacterized protein n=1 Tax=Cordylochernes scorpioides TaxID=51811 RepID=A0ABY6JX03_9ARAC|nr:hypothetical protein LAZ67_1003696 [Cordylochernes scorpioides]